MRNTSNTQDFALPYADFTSASWQMARFEVEQEPDGPFCFIIAHFPIGISAKIAYLNDPAIAELFIEALTLAQACYARAKTVRPAND